MAVRGKSTGRGNRVGYLDHETIVENRAIMREFSRTQQSNKSEDGRKAGRYRNLLLSVAGKSRSADVRSAAEVLAEHLAEGESPTEASAAAQKALEFVRQELSGNIARDWERSKMAVLGAWARTMGKGTPEAEAVLAAIPQRPVMDRAVRDNLIATGMQESSWLEVEKGGRRLAEQLASGTSFMQAAARSWRTLTANISEDARKELGRKWAEVSRSIQTEWAKTHPEDAPAPLVEKVRPAKAVRKERTIRPVKPARAKAQRPIKLDATAQERLELLEVAAADVSSWPIIQPEGQRLIEAVAAGESIVDAAQVAETLLEERRSKISAEEWELVTTEWGKILAVVGRATGELHS